MAELFVYLPGPTHLRITFVQYLIAFRSLPEAASDVISNRFFGSVVPDKGVKFCDPDLNRPRESPPKIVWGGIFDGFFAVNSDRG